MKSLGEDNTEEFPWAFLLGAVSLCLVTSALSGCFFLEVGRQQVRKQAVEREYARWISDSSGVTTFTWINDLEDPKGK